MPEFVVVADDNGEPMLVAVDAIRVVCASGDGSRIYTRNVGEWFVSGDTVETIAGKLLDLLTQ